MIVWLEELWVTLLLGLTGGTSLISKPLGELLEVACSVDHLSLHLADIWRGATGAAGHQD